MGDAFVRLVSFLYSLGAGGVIGLLAALLMAKLYEHFCNSRGYVDEWKFIWVGFLVAIIVALIPQAHEWMFSGQPDQVVFDAVSYAGTRTEAVNTLQVDFYGKLIGCAVVYFGWRYYRAGRAFF